MGSSSTTEKSESGIFDKQVNPALLPYMQDVMNLGQHYFDTGSGANPYFGPSVIEPNDALMHAYGNLDSRNEYLQQNAGGPLGMAYRQINNEGASPNQAGQIGNLSGIAGGGSAIDPSKYQNLFDTSLSQNGQVAAGLQGAAGGAQAQNYDVWNQIGQLSRDVPGQNHDVWGQLGQLGQSAQTQNYDGYNKLGALGQNAGTQNNDVYGRVGGLSSAAPQQNMDVLQRLGGMTGSSINPELRAMLDDQSSRIANKVNSSFSGMGRYGSVGHEDALARSIGAATQPVLAQSWENQQNRAQQANQQIAGIRQGDTSLAGQLDQSLAGMRQADTGLGANIQQSLAGIKQADTSLAGQMQQALGGMRQSDASLGGQLGQILAGVRQGDTSLSGNLWNTLGGSNRADTAGALGAASGMSGVQGQNISNQMNASNSVLGADNMAGQRALQWAGQLPNVTNSFLQPAQYGVDQGNMWQNQNQQEYNSQIGAYNNSQNADWSQLAKYMGSVTGVMPGFSGTGPGSYQSQGTSKTSTPFGAQQAAGLGMSLLGGKGSDIKLKTDIEKIGNDKTTGLDIYAYRYKGDPKHYPKVVGPMAQDVERLYPGSTREIDGVMVIPPETIAELLALKFGQG